MIVLELGTTQGEGEAKLGSKSACYLVQRLVLLFPSPSFFLISCVRIATSPWA